MACRSVLLPAPFRPLRQCNLAGGEVEAEPAQHEQLAVAGGEVLEREQRHG